MTQTTPRTSVRTLGYLATLGLLTVTGIALADVANTDAYASGNLTIDAGSTGVATYWIQATGSNGCDATSTSPAIITINLPAGVTASSTSLTFTACHAGSSSNRQNVTFGAAAPGNYSITHGLTDAAGSYTFHLNFTLQVDAATPPPPTDTTPPEIAYALSPAAPNGNGWYNTAVGIAWSIWDNESSISGSTGCDDETISTETTTAGVTRTCSATSAGGTNSSTTTTIKIDLTAPTASLVDGPADGSSHYWGYVPAAPTCTASDDLSGLDGTCSVSGYSSALGTHTVTASATDLAGNVGSTSATYTVLAWTVLGFYAPANDALNTVRSGSTVPLKFELYAGTTEITDTTGLKMVAKQTTACSSGTPDDVEQLATGGTSLRYDATGGQFVQNWATPKGAAGQCWVASVTGAGIDPATAPLAYFKLK